MFRFDFTKLHPDEEMIFGPLSVAKSCLPNTSFGDGPQTVPSSTNIRKIGLTTKRLIIEQGQAADTTCIIPNHEIKMVMVRRENFAGQPRLVLDTVQTRSGKIVRVDLTLMDPQAEAKIAAAFLNVPIRVKRGCLDWVPFLT